MRYFLDIERMQCGPFGENKNIKEMERFPESKDICQMERTYVQTALTDVLGVCVCLFTIFFYSSISFDLAILLY